MALNLVHNTQYENEAAGRLTGQFQNLTKIDGFIRAFAHQYQLEEDAIWQLFSQRSLAAAIGVQLDMVGAVVNVSRRGRNDADYRLAIYGQIAINTSQGTPEDLIGIFNLLTNSQKSLITFVYPAEVGIFSDHDISGLNLPLIYNICQSIIPGGKLFGIGSYNSDGSGDPAFAFDGGDVANVDGFGNADNPAIGGKFATLYYVGPIEP
jgi:hypothetical protein